MSCLLSAPGERKLSSATVPLILRTRLLVLHKNCQPLLIPLSLPSETRPGCGTQYPIIKKLIVEITAKMSQKLLAKKPFFPVRFVDLLLLCLRATIVSLAVTVGSNQVIHL
jgi:hypothetical protein